MLVFYPSFCSSVSFFRNLESLVIAKGLKYFALIIFNSILADKPSKKKKFFLAWNISILTCFKEENNYKITNEVSIFEFIIFTVAKNLYPGMTNKLFINFGKLWFIFHIKDQSVPVNILCIKFFSRIIKKKILVDRIFGQILLSDLGNRLLQYSDKTDVIIRIFVTSILRSREKCIKSNHFFSIVKNSVLNARVTNVLVPRKKLLLKCPKQHAKSEMDNKLELYVRIGSAWTFLIESLRHSLKNCNINFPISVCSVKISGFQKYLFIKKQNNLFLTIFLNRKRKNSKEFSKHRPYSKISLFKIYMVKKKKFFWENQKMNLGFFLLKIWPKFLEMNIYCRIKYYDKNCRKNTKGNRICFIEQFKLPSPFLSTIWVTINHLGPLRTRKNFDFFLMKFDNFGKKGIKKKWFHSTLKKNSDKYFDFLFSCRFNKKKRFTSIQMSNEKMLFRPHHKKNFFSCNLGINYSFFDFNFKFIAIPYFKFYAGSILKSLKKNGRIRSNQLKNLLHFTSNLKQQEIKNVRNWFLKNFLNFFEESTKLMGEYHKDSAIQIFLLSRQEFLNGEVFQVEFHLDDKLYNKSNKIKPNFGPLFRNLIKICKFGILDAMETQILSFKYLFRITTYWKKIGLEQVFSVLGIFFLKMHIHSFFRGLSVDFISNLKEKIELNIFLDFDSIIGIQNLLKFNDFFFHKEMTSRELTWKILHKKKTIKLKIYDLLKEI